MGSKGVPKSAGIYFSAVSDLRRTPTTLYPRNSAPHIDKQESLLDYLNQDDKGFIRLVANALLVAGNSPDVVLLSELLFIDLPERMQQRE